ncbi:hypothetical protein DFA_01809 [Cavenderia fasciculata]|uniref:Uncharacterized protein n=1 Tax=Cavenderia fasciculata TaxID=261658 RepID=F4PUW1_CACFS|nr:uncharacterized protein DFA_01809 [Cavenderia fasciculata]EGG21923.1 hypothetical protein DFA_01809 [Cavenderia fasciculata]|eukprot:XP_004359774.1 hypothetical protein DFA_01809 [Cavenderia fasciculata]
MSSAYSLKLEFSQAALTALNSASEKVCVVWLTFKPFPHNTIDWAEAYGIYASSTSVQHGATINRLSTLKAVSKTHQYPFNESGFFDGPNQTHVKSYGLINNYNEPLTFGLTQTAMVNGHQVDSELNAVTVLHNQSAEFTPIVTLSVYVAASFNNGSVISDISSNTLVLTYTSDTHKNIYYDDVQNCFVEGNLPL